jgi:Flp pilus assembly protein TadG
MRRGKRGAALVEFALILPILLMLFLGIIEFGVLMMHQLTLVQVAREGSRTASLGRPTPEIQTRMLNLAGALPNHDELAVNLSYSTDEGASYPYALGNVGGSSENSAPPGSLIKVTLGWPHHLLTGSFFSWMSNVQNNTLPLKSEIVMRRE